MRVIAYLLPQFHPIKENDLWWGKGFTDWVSVKAARPLFKGHRQPNEPTDELGYYNLLDKTVRAKQAQMAADAGIEGFCYWHYWFNGKQLLEQPFEQVLQSQEPNFPFCLGWANESWRAKEWSMKSGKNDKILIEQTYSETDNDKHFHHLLPALQDKRYIKINNKPVFIIYKPLELPNAKQFVSRWNTLAQQNGLDGIYFIGHSLYSKDSQKIIDLGFNAVNIVPLGDCRRSTKLILKSGIQKIKHLLGLEPFVYQYKDTITFFAQDIFKENKIIPTILPNWDHTPRSKKHGMVFANSTPCLFKLQIRKIKQLIQNKPQEEQVVFLKSWNEWGEGNYIEPDKKYGNAYLQALQSELKNA